jgi:hypothetical protein
MGVLDNLIGVDDERLTAEQLLRAAKEAGFEVSERRLEDWRYRGLMPRPERVASPGKAPLWLYPAGAREQLIALCRYREKTKDMDAVKVGLWFDGFPIDKPAVRDAIAAVLGRMRDLVERTLLEQAQRADEGRPLTQGEAIDKLAHRAAGKHGSRPSPRTIRMPRSDRARGIAFMLRLFMGYDLGNIESDAKFAEQAMGLSAGRRGLPQRWLEWPAEELANLRSIIALPVLIDAAQTATTEELARARGFARAFVHGLPLIVLFAEALLGPRAGGLAAAKNIDDQPELICMLVPALVSALRHGYGDNLELLQPTLEEIVATAGPTIAEIAALPDREKEKRISATPASERPTLRRLIKLRTERDNRKSPQTKQ